MKDLYVLAYAQNPIVADAKAANEVELIMPVVHEVFDQTGFTQNDICLLYTSPSPRDVEESRMPSSA